MKLTQHYGKSILTRCAQDVVSSEMELYEGCGTTKSCVGAPLGCLEAHNCDAALAVTSSNSGSGYVIDMIGKHVKYIATGFSDDTGMVSNSYCLSESIKKVVYSDGYIEIGS